MYTSRKAFVGLRGKALGDSENELVTTRANR